LCIYIIDFWLVKKKKYDGKDYDDKSGNLQAWVDVLADIVQLGPSLRIDPKFMIWTKA
jgi:hypothetical protein